MQSPHLPTRPEGGAVSNQVPIDPLAESQGSAEHTGDTSFNHSHSERREVSRQVNARRSTPGTGPMMVRDALVMGDRLRILARFPSAVSEHRTGEQQVRSNIWEVSQDNLGYVNKQCPSWSDRDADHCQPRLTDKPEVIECGVA